MRLLKAGCASLVLTLGLGYAVFISIPVGRHIKTVDSAVAARSSRHTLLKPKIKDPQVNGFLTPKLEQFWGRGQDNGGPVKDAVTNWTTAYSAQGKGGQIDHAALQKAKDPTYLRARQAFEGLLADLVTAFGKPVFQPVNDDLNAPTSALNDVALKQLAMGLNGYAESLVAEGKPEQAALVYELVFRSGYLVSNDVRIVETMIGVGLQGLALQSLTGHLRLDAPLSPNQWVGLSTALAALTPTPVTLTRSLENDVAFGIAFLNRPRASYDGDAKPLRGAYLLPGFRARDVRIYSNQMGPLLEQAKRGIIEQQPLPIGLGAILKGESGPGPSLLVPDYDKQSARMALHSAKMGGLAAATGACAYRAKFGKLPSKLADLDTLRLQAPGGTAWSTVKGLKYTNSGDRGQVAVSVSKDLFARAGVDFARTQEREKKNSAYFRVHEDGYIFEL